MQESIMLFKALLKANGLYGAESYIRGLSGYVCEILGIHYKSFSNLIKAASEWKPREVIDPEGHFKTKEAVLMGLNASKLGPLIVIDPVQKSRNAAAAFSSANLQKLNLLCKQLIKKPSKNLFVLSSITEAQIRKRAGVVLWLEIKPLEGKEDIIGSKILKTLNFLGARLKENGFEIKDKGWQWKPGEVARAWFIVKSPIPRNYTLLGPPLSKPEFVKEFKKKHARCREQNNKVIAFETRKHTKGLRLVEELIKEEYVVERVKKVVAR